MVQDEQLDRSPNPQGSEVGTLNVSSPTRTTIPVFPPVTMAIIFPRGRRDGGNRVSFGPRILSVSSRTAGSIERESESTHTKFGLNGRPTKGKNARGLEGLTADRRSLIDEFLGPDPSGLCVVCRGSRIFAPYRLCSDHVSQLFPPCHQPRSRVVE